VLDEELVDVRVRAASIEMSDRLEHFELARREAQHQLLVSRFSRLLPRHGDPESSFGEAPYLDTLFQWR